MIYLDNNATTKIDAEVLDAMMPYLNELYGNPSGKYLLAQQANDAVNNSRLQISELLNVQPEEVIFTSGASESNNFIIKGIADTNSTKGNHVITSSIEHKSVIETCKYLETKGYQVTYLTPTHLGLIPIESLAKAITDQTILVSIGWVNNELGTINDVPQMSKLCQENGILFHTDATQAVGKLSIDLSSVPVNFLSFSGHKIYAPKGIGVCYLRKTKLGLKQKITPLIHGGDQEFGFRAGTLAVPNIVGVGKAAEVALRDFDANISKIQSLDSSFCEQLMSNVHHVSFNGCKENKVAGVVNFTISGISNELIIRKLSSQVALSTGSACSANKPSHVLQALGLSLEQIRSSFRVSLSKYNTVKDFTKLISTLRSND